MAKFSPLMILPPVLFAAFAGAAYFSMTHNDPERLKSMREGTSFASLAGVSRGMAATWCSRSIRRYKTPFARG